MTTGALEDRGDLLARLGDRLSDAAAALLLAVPMTVPMTVVMSVSMTMAMMPLIRRPGRRLVVKQLTPKERLIARLQSLLLRQVRHHLHLRQQRLNRHFLR